MFCTFLQFLLKGRNSMNTYILITKKLYFVRSDILCRMCIETQIFWFHHFPGVLDIKIWKQMSVKKKEAKQFISGQNFNSKQIEIIL